MDLAAYHQHMNIRMSTRGKRPLRNLTPSDKVRAIQRIHNGETKASVSRDIGVPESTLRGWCKNEQKLRFMCRQLASDHMSLADLDSPSEKRGKYEGTSLHSKLLNGNMGKFEDLRYARLNLNGIHFTAHNNSNAILGKTPYTDTVETTNIQGDSKHFSSVHHLPGLNTTQMIGDFGALPLVQNFNLLALLNPGIAAMHPADTTATKSKAPLATTNSPEKMKHNVTNSFATALTVKNWAKDPSDNVKTSRPANTDSTRCTNATNNHDVKPSISSLSSEKSESGSFSSLFMSSLAHDVPNLAHGAESNNVLEWCKVFNASLNFMALAAAAAALNPVNPTKTHLNDENKTNLDAYHSVQELLYQQLTKMPKAYDTSDDSFESEPEDLSVRSATSKISSVSTTTSRSQSPDKSTQYSFSNHSDCEP